MRRIYILLLFVTSVLGGCQYIEPYYSPSGTPSVGVSEVYYVGTTSAILSGKFSSIHEESVVLCLNIYDDTDYEEYYYYPLSELSLGSITVEIENLQSGTQYYYKFGAVHGELNKDGTVTRYSPSEVWGETKTFVTEESLVKSINVTGYEYYHTVWVSGLVESYVKYGMELIFNDSMLEEIQNSDYKEYGFYAVAEDGSFAEFTPEWSMMTKGKIVFTPKIDKEMFKVSRTSGLYHAQTAACKIGFYVMDQNSDIIRITEDYHPGFEYSLQPKIEILGVDPGDKIVNEDHVYDVGYVPYTYSYKIEGALFFDTFIAYDRGRTLLNKTYSDMEEGFHTLASVNPDTEAKVEYLYYTAVVDGVTIVPEKCIRFVYDGHGNVDISLSSHVPSSY